MFQPRVKLEFVQRYCAPQDGWRVSIDIDASEEGRTGSKRKTEASRIRQAEMITDAPKVRDALNKLGVNVGDRKRWCKKQSLPYIEGDPDIVAYDQVTRRCLIVEVEGASSGQPEQKLYKAIGQIVRTASNLPTDWDCRMIIVVYGDKIANHLGRARALDKLAVTGMALTDNKDGDRFLFGASLV
jgi:hypothetical protein